MNERNPMPTVDAAIERLIAAMPLRRPSTSLDARIDALLERRAQPWWLRVVPLATAAGLLLAVGFVAGSWVGQARLSGGSYASEPRTTTTTARDDGDVNLVLQDSSMRRAGLAAPRMIDLGDDGTVRAADSLWIRTDRYHDPQRGVTIERSYPEAWTLMGTPSAD